MPLDRDQRRRLRSLLATDHPWLDRTDVGPRAVDAGECDRCGRAPRVLPTCGPGGDERLCVDCGLAAGTDAWCTGHVDDADEALAWAATLPHDWAAVVRLWWVATGEVALDPALLDTSDRLGELVSRAARPGS